LRILPALRCLPVFRGRTSSNSSKRTFTTRASSSRFDCRAEAGITVGIVALPLAMAFAIASGVKPEAGIFTAIIAGFLISALPTLSCGILLVAFGNYTMRSEVAWGAVGSVVLTAAVVPFIEEGFFRGLIQGIILRDNRPLTATLLSAGVFAIIHFLKAPEETTTSVTWASGFLSLAHSFDQFAEPMLVLAGCTTLFLIGVILAHARLRTRSLWLPIGLHVGWIFASSEFNKVAHRELVVLPWLGKNLLVGIVPLFVCFVSWILLGVFLKYGVARKS